MLKDSKINQSMRDKIQNTLSEELFIGICAPIGSKKQEVIKTLSSILKNDYNYKIKIIKLSKLIDKFKIKEYKNLEKKSEGFSLLKNKLNQGNLIRYKYSNNSILIELAIQEIILERSSQSNQDHSRNCYIFDSIKNKEELLLLRQLYANNFYQFSIFSPYAERIESLLSKGLQQHEVEEIISSDAFENDSFGQNVRETFTNADFFLRVSNNHLSELECRIKRFLHIMFESEIVTPTLEEQAMYMAKTAAGNSACLSRQVGATVTDKNGTLISVGWNDVPKYGGNLYLDNDLTDNRCKKSGFCSNDKEKYNLINHILEILKSDSAINHIFNDENGNFDITKYSLIFNKLRCSKIKNLMEFSRSVHAEMHAIISASQLSGPKMINGKLFCTTYPCHNCAKHIIVAGIKEVFYIEPYIKSLSTSLHSDAITEDESCTDKVRILMYDGIAPNKYLQLFTLSQERKDKKGNIIIKDLKTIKPKLSQSSEGMPNLEQKVLKSLEDCGIFKNRELDFS